MFKASNVLGIKCFRRKIFWATSAMPSARIRCIKLWQNIDRFPNDFQKNSIKEDMVLYLFLFFTIS